MEVVKCGTLATTRVGKINGIITCINLRYESVRYEFSYFYSGDYKQIWMDETELEIEEIETQTIGFK